MRVSAEVFKGIEFIRISNLPEDQRQQIIASMQRDKIINILRDKVIMKDCVQYHDYLTWYAKYTSQPVPVSEKAVVKEQEKQTAYRLAFK